MLSRVADCLFWMSRYVERAENIARLVDVNTQLLFDLPLRHSESMRKNWFPLVETLGEEESFRKRSRRMDVTAVTEFLVFDREAPNSITNCLSAARENARTVREQISAEMWEEINRVYLWACSKAARQAHQRNQYDYFQRIKQFSHLFQGLTNTTMVHGEGWEFIQLGKYLERADKTSRVLDDQYHILDKSSGLRGRDLLQWAAVLRSTSGVQTYQRLYVSHVQPIKVAELLLLNPDFPRSVRFCVEHLDGGLRRLSGSTYGHFSNPAEKLTGRFLAELSFSDVEDVYGIGLHEAVDQLQCKLNQIGSAIFETYINQALPPEPAVPVSGWVEQETPQQ